MKRCDHLPLLDANPGKIRALREVLAAFRAAAPDVAADQWRRFFETARFNKMVSAEEEVRSPRLARAKSWIGAVRLQMLRFQIVGQLESFLANRANDFRDTVLASTLDETTRHQLLTINTLHAWFRREALVMPSTGEEIPGDIRHLARRIMHGVLARHRRPRFNRLNPWIDRRQARVGAADRAAHASLWVSIRGMRRAIGQNGKLRQTQANIQVPLQSYAWFEARGGEIAKTIQLIERGADRGQPGELVIGVVSDMAGPFGTSRAAYQPLRAELALDFGLSTMFATGEGDLLGRAWFDQLKRHDARIAGLARQLQRQGIRPNRSRRYRARVAAFRGFLKTEIGRVMNRLVALKRPARIVIEKLDFRAPRLSRRLNRILARSGRAIIREKLTDLEDRFGITFVEVNPAYSSQTCSACGFVARTNRRSQSEFSCRACGHEVHADVNAARNLEGGRSAFDREARYTKAETLRLTVHRHLERDTSRGRVTSARVFESPYYRTFAAAQDTPLINKSPLPDVVADVSAG
jgi:putative transposase